MLCDDRRQAALDFRESFFPCGFNKPSVAFDQRLAQAVRILMQVFQRHTFGAKVAATEDVGCMSANALYPALSHGDLQAAASFTERANTMVDGWVSCFSHRYSSPAAAPMLSGSPDQYVQGNGFAGGCKPSLRRFGRRSPKALLSQMSFMDSAPKPVAAGLWRWLQGTGLERFEFLRAADEWLFRGTILTLAGDAAIEARYEIWCDHLFRTRRANVSVRNEAGERSLQIDAQDGHWFEN